MALQLHPARTVVKISKVKTKAPLSAKKPVVTTVRPSTPTRGRPNLRPSAEAKTPGPLTVPRLNGGLVLGTGTVFL